MSEKVHENERAIRIKSVLRRLIYMTLAWIEIAKRWLRSLAGQAKRKKQIIICGYPRSGTSLFYNMLSSSLLGFQIDDRETSALDSVWKYDDHASKSPVDLFRLGDIAKKNIHNKELCVIVMIRDIRDIITSRHQFAPDSFVISYQGAYSFSGVYPSYLKKFDGPGIERYYSVMEELINDDSFNLIFIRYEDLVADADKCQQKVAISFGVQFDGLFSRYHLRKDRHKIKYEGEHTSLDKSLDKSSDAVETKYVKRWTNQEYRKRIKEQFSEHPKLFEILLKQGYENSQAWYKEYE